MAAFDDVYPRPQEMKLALTGDANGSKNGFQGSHMLGTSFYNQSLAGR